MSYKAFTKILDTTCFTYQQLSLDNFNRNVHCTWAVVWQLYWAPVYNWARAPRVAIRIFMFLSLEFMFELDIETPTMKLPPIERPWRSELEYTRNVYEVYNWLIADVLWSLLLNDRWIYTLIKKRIPKNIDVC